MTPPKLDEEAIFHVARKITPAAVRDEYLRQACGDDEALRGRVLDLLRVHDEAQSFLRVPALGPGATVDELPAIERPGTRIGPYKLLEQLAEGGMGTVYMAEQQEPVHRLVALKIIKPGMASAHVIARFEAERQALALMDHPNIAKILDAGASESGRAYFVMELVKGIPITKYCDERRLRPRERLELFIPVCQAVQHAHLKGVIHRDLKPSNVLVALYDGKPVPKVIDFGIAKALGQPLTEKTLFTGFGAVVGTPEYMSPEQAELNQLDIDTRSDVYSLGVLLYELLTGSTPLERKRLTEGALLEVLRAIREEEPPRPSTRLSTSEGLATLSTQRGTEPAQLTRLVRGDLDWIVMKALEKDRARRYETANGLAQDVERYLRDEPVQAGPPGAAYRLRKFVRRNRGPVAAATFVLLALVAGVIGTTVGLVRSLEAEGAAAVAAEDASVRAVEAVKARTVADREKAAAETERDRARFQAARAEDARHAMRIEQALYAWRGRDLLEAERVLATAEPRDRQTWEYRHLRDLCRRTGLAHLGQPWRLVALNMIFSPDRKRLATSNPGEPVQVRDCATDQATLTLPAHTKNAYGVAFSPDGRRLAASCNDRTVRVWDAATGKEQLVLQADAMCVTFSADGARLAAGDDEAVKVWDAASGQLQHTFQGHKGAILAAAFSGDGRILVTTSNDNDVLVWNMATGTKRANPQGWRHPYDRVAVAHDGQAIFTSARSTVMVTEWSAALGRGNIFLRGHREGILAIALSPDGWRLASGSRDRTVKVWDVGTGQEQASFLGHTGPVAGVAFSADGTRVYSAGLDGRIRVWDPTVRQDTLSIKGGAGPALSVAFSPDGRRLVAGLYKNTLKVWDAATGAEELALKGHTAAVRSAAFSPDGARIVSGSNDHSVRVWDARTGAELLSLEGHAHPVQSVAFSARGDRLASASLDRTVRVWDAATGKTIHVLRQTAGPFPATAFSPDGRHVVSVSADRGGRANRTVTLWDAATGREECVFKVPAEKPAQRADTGPIKSVTQVAASVAFSPDGRQVLVAIGGQTATLWDVATGQEVLTLRGHAGQVLGVAFSPDGRRVATAGADATVRLWDAKTGQEVLTLRGHSQVVWAVAFSPDGRRLASASHDGTVKIWEAPPP
jgi:WD40 repeat protein/serine/threonine protein kinase